MTGFTVVLISISFGFPVPDAIGLLIPITGALVHAKVVPTVALVEVYENRVLLQIAGGFKELVKVGRGFTRTVAVIDVPVHPFADGVIVNVTVTGAVVLLVNVPVIFPLPLAAIPVTVALLSLVQLKVVPVTLPLNTIVEITLAEQIV